jgi:hypothetical protein
MTRKLVSLIAVVWIISSVSFAKNYTYSEPINVVGDSNKVLCTIGTNGVITLYDSTPNEIINSLAQTLMVSENRHARQLKADQERLDMLYKKINATLGKMGEAIQLWLPPKEEPKSVAKPSADPVAEPNKTKTEKKPWYKRIF